MSSSFLNPTSALLMGTAIWAFALMNAPQGAPGHAANSPSSLKPQATPENLDVETYPQEKATDARPLVVVVASDPTYCSKVREAYASLAHVLCGGGSLEHTERSLKEGAAHLKKTYPSSVAPPPAHLYVDAAHAKIGWRLLLKEPSFFSYAYVAGLKEQSLNNVTLRTLHGIGGGSRGPGMRTLILDIENSKRLEFLINVASRRGLTVKPIGESAGSLGQAIRLVQAADERLTPSLDSSKSF